MMEYVNYKIFSYGFRHTVLLRTKCSKQPVHKSLNAFHDVRIATKRDDKLATFYLKKRVYLFITVEFKIKHLDIHKPKEK